MSRDADAARQLAATAARLIALAEEMKLPDAPDRIVSARAVQFLARAHVDLLDQVRALQAIARRDEAVLAALAKVGLDQPLPGWRPGPRLVPDPGSAPIAASDLAATYHRVMHRSHLDFAADGAKFIVRGWDGMDGCWTDVTGDVDAGEALRAWAERTGGGRHHVSYDEIDYYAIFPDGTRMYWDGSEGKEAFR